MTATDLIQLFEKNANQADKIAMERFFQTGPGQYAEGDQFIGLKVSVIRKLLPPFYDLSFENLQFLIISPIHEHRMAALLILVRQYHKNRKKNPQPWVDFYLQNIDHVNNWDLVDSSCRDILGNFLMFREKDVLYQLVHSPNIWQQRIAIVSTWRFIRNKQFTDTLQLSKILLKSKEAIVQKGLGWMLKCMVDEGEFAEVDLFLRDNIEEVSRLIITITIEKLSDEKRSFYRLLKTSYEQK